METKFYNKDVSFLDPLTKITGIESYMNNVNTLAGRTFIGKLIFEDASISLHKVTVLPDNKIQTRWTLKVTAKVLPWKPRATFTGISVYTLDNMGRVAKQEDYWDSINLNRGEYSFVSLGEGIADFLGQLKQEQGAEMAAPELPYELLRRAKRYEVRKYPATIVAETTYEQRPQGYDRLASYASGSNVKDSKISYFSPTIMRVSGSSATSNREKFMSWPLTYELPKTSLPPVDRFPESTVPSVQIKKRDEFVVAVCRFDVAATEPVARGYTDQLRRDILADKLTPTVDVNNGVIIVGQYDALFSLNKRRNEVWIELADHPWI